MATKNQKARKQERISTARRRAEQHKTGGERTALAVPEGLQKWQYKKDETYTIDILPFVVSDRKYTPECSYADPGQEHFEQSYWVHYNIGADEKSYICMAKTFGKPCPICEDRRRLDRKGVDQDTLKALNPKERQIYLVRDHADPKKIQWLEAAHFNFGKLLDQRVRTAKIVGPGDARKFDTFYYSDESGFTLDVVFSQETTGSNNFLKASSIDFTKRDEPLPKGIMSQVAEIPPLSEWPKEISYDKLRKIYLQITEETETQEDNGQPSKSKSPKGKAPPVDEDEDDSELEDDDPTADEAGLKEGDSVMHDKLGECIITKISKDGTSLTLKPPKGKSITGVAPFEVELLEDEDEDEDEDEPAPKGKAGARGGKSSPPKDEEDEDEDEDEDDSELEDEEDDDDSELEDEEDDDDDSELEDEDEDDDDSELEVPPKKGGKKVAAGKRGKK